MWFMCLDFLAKIEKRKGGKKTFLLGTVMELFHLHSENVEKDIP